MRHGGIGGGGRGDEVELWHVGAGDQEVAVGAHGDVLGPGS